MPMPPPKPSSEGNRDRQVVHEMAQIVRALASHGPQERSELAGRVGAEYWDDHRFDRALAFVVADGRVVRLSDGRLQAV